MLSAPLQLTAVELRDRLEGGLTRPWVVVATDDEHRHLKVVLKLKDPGRPVGDGHYGGTSLACELICAVLAKVLGLGVARYAIVTVTREFAGALPGTEARTLFRQNIGEHFGSEYHPGLAPWQPNVGVSSQALIDQLEDTVTFDATVINGDRKAGKPNLLYRGEKLLLIDHSLALPSHLWNDEQIEESPLFPEEQVRRHCSAKQLYERCRSYDRVPKSWKQNIDSQMLVELRGMIPPSWERNPGDIDKIFRFLDGRSARLTDISVDLVRILK